MEPEIEARIEKLLPQLTLEEKVFMLSGHGFMQQVAAGRYCGEPHQIGAGNERLGVGTLRFLDGPRGVAMGESTCFPVSMARGASFDVDLERRIGDAIGRELRACGANLFGGVCINLLRHPAWGRAQETYGEDPFLLGELGAALVEGVQHHNVVATPKHFACNSMENARFSVDVSADERTLREVYLPHFKRCVDAGALAVMSAYNQLNGAYCGHNPELLTGILKDEWGFDGFVYSDFVLGCRGADACQAGLDVEAPDTYRYGDKLVEAVNRGDVSAERIDDAVRRVLRSLFRIESREDPESYSPASIACAAHVELAREAAEKSVVLLKNERGALPLDAGTRLLVVGPLADVPNLGDHGSSRVYPPKVVTPLAGLRAAGVPVTHDSGDDLEALASRAAEAEAVLVVTGYTAHDEGEFIPGSLGGDDAEGGDRIDLTLGETQEAMIRTCAAACPRTVVAVMSGSAVLMERWRHEVAAILMLWYPGMEGGRALADLLLGRANPSGRLPFSVPTDAAHLPFFDRDASAITYDRWHGYTKLERDGVPPAFAFGFGLSYTEFEFADAAAALDGDELRAEVSVRNVGPRSGTAVVQVYAGRAEPDPDEPRKRLCGFARVELAPDESRRVSVPVALSELASYDEASRSWQLEPATWRVQVGPSSAEGPAARIELPARSWSIRER